MNAKYAATPVITTPPANSMPLTGADRKTYVHNPSATSAGSGNSHIMNGCGLSQRKEAERQREGAQHHQRDMREVLGRVQPPEQAKKLSLAGSGEGDPRVP